MQVNSLSTNEHATYMKEGCCFSYSQTGHIQCACPLKDKKAKMLKISTNPFQTTAVQSAQNEELSLKVQIWNLMTKLPQDH